MTPQDWLRARAKEMRVDMTPHEKAMWRLLHEGELVALYWRRQVAFGDYVLDFVSHPARLVLEIDDSQHATAENAERDAARTAWLQSEGYRVLRFWNVDVFKASDGVWRVIQSAALETPAAARILRWRKTEQAKLKQKNASLASSSMEEAPRSGGGGDSAGGERSPLEAKPQSHRAAPPQSSLRDDSSSIEEEH